MKEHSIIYILKKFQTSGFVILGDIDSVAIFSWFSSLFPKEDKRNSRNW